METSWDQNKCWTPYGDGDASAVAERLDGEVLGLLRQVTGTT